MRLRWGEHAADQLSLAPKPYSVAVSKKVDAEVQRRRSSASAASAGGGAP
jgi:hypothetical protein